MDKNLLYKWVAIFTCTIFGFFVIHMFNLWNALWSADQTKISFVILTIWSIASLFLLYEIFKPKAVNDELLWFTSESLVTLGLIGTVSGFLLMLYSAFADIDVSNIDSLTASLDHMATGMSTALTTTLVGLISSLHLKVQLMLVESHNAKQ
jgi:hypothetical protein